MPLMNSIRKGSAMFRCNDCGQEFEEFLQVEERHNLDAPPYEVRSVCPRCKSSAVYELIRDRTKRTTVIERVLQAERYFNEFSAQTEKILNSDIMEIFNHGVSELWELFDLMAVGGSDFRMPTNADSLFFKAQSNGEFEILRNVAFKYITEG